ncbi:hypothetical protein K469DRAFT_206017 [Zopfia rhizophila CBS 207.26]|uniref:Uncharacterized protein n=1 Tax=Zopfia rhizophila CBS 207.26 TaxID=1314779 RepID=A0A6A6E0H1_9PEZI|nr:hypothetical protein K469DRAFT_206017 [Zopfia rhizophila CBS 207.26]
MVLFYCWMIPVRAASRSLFVIFFFIGRVGWLLSTWIHSSSSKDESGRSCDFRSCVLFSVSFLARSFPGAAGSIGNSIVLGLRSGVEMAIGAPGTTMVGPWDRCNAVNDQLSVHNENKRMSDENFLFN